MIEVELSEELHNLVMIPSISAQSRAGRMCIVGSWLKTAILAGRQLLKPPDHPVHARTVVSPELVSSYARNRPSALSPSPYEPVARFWAVGPRGTQGFILFFMTVLYLW